MPCAAKILSLVLLLATISLQASSAAYVRYSFKPGQNPIFDLHSYENASRVFAVCDETSRQRWGPAQTRCLVSQVDGDRGQQRNCSIALSTSRRGAVVQPGSMQVMRFGADKAILSWIDTSSNATRWRPMVVLFQDCSIHEPEPEYLSDIQPVKLMVYDRWFEAIVSSDRPGDRCHLAPSSNRNVRRCMVMFDDRANLLFGPFPRFVQAARDDSMIVVPLKHGTTTADHLLVDTFQRQRDTIARVSILHLNGRVVPLHNYTILDANSTDVDPYERIAYSTANGYIGVCARTTGSSLTQLTCHQWNREGEMNLETTFQVTRHRHMHEFAVMNLPGYGGMLLLTADCQDISCRNSDNRNYVSRIESDGSTGVSGSLWFGKHECDRRINRADAQIYEGPAEGQYCFSQVCYEDFFYNDYKDPGQRRSREFGIDGRCFSDDRLAGRKPDRPHNYRQDEGQELWSNRFFTQWYGQ